MRRLIQLREDALLTYSSLDYWAVMRTMESPWSSPWSSILYLVYVRGSVGAVTRWRKFLSRARLVSCPMTLSEMNSLTSWSCGTGSLGWSYWNHMPCHHPEPSSHMVWNQVAEIHYSVWFHPNLSLSRVTIFVGCAMSSHNVRECNKTSVML